MDDETTQVQVKSASKTKMAIAVGFLGLAALAAGFAGLRGSVLRPDLIHFMSTTAADGGLNKFSVTLKNVGGSDVRSPFILNIKLGDGVNVVRKIKVLSDQTKEGYENLESDNGSFDILVTNYRLGRNQKTTITYWFVIPSDYNSDFLPLTYTLDTTNVVPESNELNNMYKGKFNIAQAGFIKDTAYFYGYGYNPVTGEPNQPSYGYGYNPVTGEINCQSSNDCGVGGGVGYCVNGQQTSTFSTGKCLSTGVCEVITTTNTCTDSNVSSTAFASTTPVVDSTNIPALPDLVIKDFSVTRSSYAGMKHFTITINNIGNATAVRPSTMHQNFGTFVVQVYFIAEDGSVIASPYLSSDLYYSSMSLAAGKGLTISKDMQLSDAILNASKKIKMKVDWLDGSVVSVAPFTYPDKGYILESNEDNNELTKIVQS